MLHLQIISNKKLTLPLQCGHVYGMFGHVYSRRFHYFEVIK